MISRTSKINLRVVILAGLAMSLPVAQAHAYSVKYAPGYSSKRSIDVDFIYPKYPKGYVPAVDTASDVPEDNRPEIIEYHVTTHKYVHITINHVRRFYRPYIRVHRAASFLPSRIRLHRAGTFGF